ncbi:MAG: hypothetical protein WD468_06060, partial [Pirellulales bacterium]
MPHCPSFRRSRTRTLTVERLDARWMLCAEHLGGQLLGDQLVGGDASVPIPPEGLPPVVLGQNRFEGTAAAAPPAYGANGLPLLESLAGAPTAVYLDFDGFSGEGYGGFQTHAPYDIDGNPSTFNSQEQGAITEGWRRIAAHFAPFHTNVTTIVPSVPFSWSLITNSNTSVGYSWLQFNGFAPSSSNPSGDLLGRTNGILHEIGHNFSLAHQSEYDLLGNKTREYRGAIDPLHGPIMGVDYDGTVPKWYLGHPSSSPSSLQDDVARIASKIIPHQGAGGDGMRPDDHGATIAAATPISGAGDVVITPGIIERLADRDAFSFSTASGVVSIDVTRHSLSGVDLKLELFAANGTLLAASDSAANDQHLTLTLPAGTFYPIVSSHGDYGDLGPYNLTLQSLPAGWSHQDVGSVGVAGYTSYHPPTGTFIVAGSGSGISGSSDEFQFAYQKLTGDGSITARVTNVADTNASAKAGVMIRETLAGGSKHAYMLTSRASGDWLRSRSSTGGSSADSPRTAVPFSPIWLRLVRAGNTFSGYTSPDGTNWTLEGTATVSMVSTVLIGLATTATNDSVLNDANYTNVTVTGTLGDPPPALNGLPAPAGVAVTGTSSTGINLSWNDGAGETSYTVERSADGATYVTAGTSPAGTTTFSDAGLASHQRFFYRVRANDAGGVSAASNIVHALTRPGAVTSLSVTSWTEDKLILNWLDRSGDSGYRVERSTDGTNWSAIATVGTNVPSDTNVGLAGGTTYSYRVVTVDAGGDAATSGVVIGSTRLAAVGGLALSEIMADQIRLSWTDINSESGYLIERSTDGETYSSQATLPADSTTYLDDTVTPADEFYYRVSGQIGAVPGTTSAVVFAGTPGATPLPGPWVSADVGNVAGPGAAGFDADTFTLISAGSDLENTTDSAHYVYQPLVGDGTLIARVASLENTHGSAETGLMVRESTVNNSKQFAVVTTPGNGAKLRYRTATGGSSATSGSGASGPQWLKLVRAGNRFTGYTSPDGAIWTQLGSTQTIAMPETVLVGLASISHEAQQLNTSTFDHVTLGLPAPIATADAYTLAEDSSLVTGVPAETVLAAGSSWKYIDDGT